MCKFLFGDSVLALNYKYYQVTSSVKTFSNLHFRSRYRTKREPPKLGSIWGGSRPNVHLKETCRKTNRHFRKFFEKFFQSLRRATEASFCPILACDTALETFELAFKNDNIFQVCAQIGNMCFRTDFNMFLATFRISPFLMCA